MLIELQNNTTINSESVVSVRLADDVWTIKMSNGYPIILEQGEYEWFMKINGMMIEVLPDLAVNIDAIVLFEPNETGYIIGWEGEPPIDMSTEKWELLKQQI